VEANSVFFKGAVIQHPLSDKELSQLMDLREDWGPSLIHILLEWDSGASPPLQKSVEFILSTFLWLGLDSGHILQEDNASLARKKPNESFSYWEFDWARIRSPFVGVPGSEAIPDSPVERLAYFGWVWEPGDALNVSTATKANDAEANLALWNVGGDGPGMEHARSTLRNWLHLRWWRAMTSEATCWLRNQGVADGHEQWQCSRDAIADCITWAANSTWWDWSDGSCLFFWRWPDPWHLEARDGAKSYRMAKPLFAGISQESLSKSLGSLKRITTSFANSLFGVTLSLVQYGL
jgi:hypothetical protein